MNNMDEGLPTNWNASQITWQKGEFNITLRSDYTDKASMGKLVGELLEARDLLLSQVGVQGSEATQLPSTGAQKETCDKCQSDMILKTKTKKDGGTYQVFECTNSNCNTNEYNGKFYRTTKFPKKS